MDALDKIKDLIRCKKIKNNKVNLVVLRINKSGDLCESAPCYHCTKELFKNNLININKLYYSRTGGIITCVKFNDWVECGTTHVSKGWKWFQKK